MINYWQQQQEFEKFLIEQYEEAYAMMAEQEYWHKQELEALQIQYKRELAEQKEYLIDKIDEYLAQRVNEFADALVRGDVEQVVGLERGAKELVRA